MAKQSTIAIVGASYVGLRLAQALIPVLPPTYRVVVIESNSHFHHLFTFPRFSVLPNSGEEKAFVPYTHALDSAKASLVHAKALSIHAAPNDPTKGIVKLDRESGEGKREVEFDYLAIATGTQLTRPWSLASEPKTKAAETLRGYQEAVREAKNIVIVGGGAVGVQVACDIAELYPTEESGKRVTLVHSRERVMNNFHPNLHGVVAKRFEERGVKTVLGKRVKIPPSGAFPAFEKGKTFDVELQNSDGEKVEADLVLMCTGQSPRSSLLASFCPSAIASNGFINVHPTMQIRTTTSPSSVLESKIFALGDIANSGAAKAARAAMPQIDVIKSNILSLIAGKPPTETFKAGPAGIHLSLGLYESIKFGNPEKEGDAPRNMGIERDLKRDMNVEGRWKGMNVPEGTPWHL